jgi:peptide/nickel transport system substrate-binding protein
MPAARRSSTRSLLVMLSLVLAACGGTSQSSAPSGSAGSGTGGTVRIGIGGSPDSLNPGNGLLTEAYTLYELIYDTAINLTGDGNYEPELATSWSVGDDGLTWTLELVDNATFHDGTALTSADVKYTLELYRDTEDFQYLSSYPDVFETIEAPDATHLTITTSSPIVNFEYRMTFLYILPKHIWEQQDDVVEFENAEMIGSGPFKLVENRQGQFTRLGANGDYWKAAPFVDEVIFQTIEIPDARVAALTNGDVDMITEFPATAITALQNADNVEVSITDPISGSLRDVFFNIVEPENCPPDDPETPADDAGVCSGHPALRDLEVRKALAMAIDKQQIIDVAQLGLAAPGLTLLPRALGDFFASDVSDYAYDADAANQILDDAGYRDTNGDGVRECKAGQGCDDLTFRVNFSEDNDTAPREAELIQAMWEAIGVNVTIRALDAEALTSVCCPTFDYDVIIWTWGSDPDPAFLLGVPLCTEVSTGFNETGYCNPDYDDLYAQQGVETDPAARVAIIHEMQQILVDDVVYIVPYYDKNKQAFRTDRFTGWWDGETSWGLEDPSSLTVIRPVQ